jgi:hypothetical protein
LELDALEQQIESSMTSGQLQVIDEMGLTEQSVSELLQSTVSSPGSSSNSTASSSSASSTTGSSSSSQGGGLSGMPAGGQGGPGGDSLTSTINGDVTSVQSTPAATQSVSNTASAQVSPMLVQAVIQMLKSLSQGAASSSQASG